jgi:hypothetical protein
MIADSLLATPTLSSPTFVPPATFSGDAVALLPAIGAGHIGLGIFIVIWAVVKQQ